VLFLLGLAYLNHPVVRFILDQILSDQEADERILRIHEYLERLRVDLEAGHVPLSLLTITKQLTKNPEEYADKKSLPHVLVALRLNLHGGRKLKQGDTVTYIICEVFCCYLLFSDALGNIRSLVSKCTRNHLNHTLK
jgi:DNA polymerase elongation subunit (family B)